MRKISLVSLCVGTACVAVAYATAWSRGGTPDRGIWIMIAGVSLVMSGMLALGATRSGVSRPRVVGMALVMLFLMLAGFGLPMVLPAETFDGPLLLGLPLRAAIEIYGVGLSPALFLPWIFAREFRAAGLDAAALDRLRAECATLRSTSRLE